MIFFWLMLFLNKYICLTLLGFLKFRKYIYFILDERN